MIEQTLALHLLIPLVRNGSVSMRLRERYRGLTWLTHLGQLKPLPVDYFERFWADGEIPTLQAIATEHSRWPPPAGWLPADGRSRALILTGRFPPEKH